MIISVASGKGGTGKTLVAASLDLSLKDKYKVQPHEIGVIETGHADGVAFGHGKLAVATYH